MTHTVCNADIKYSDIQENVQIILIDWLMTNCSSFYK